jgi:hypothetical protein
MNEERIRTNVGKEYELYVKRQSMRI